MQIQIHQLFGIWKLLYINVTDPSADQHYGPNLIGRIIITPESYFNAMITDLPQINGSLPWKNATDAQRGLIAKRMVVYEGPITLVEENNTTFTHVQVESSLVPEWTPSLQVREAHYVEEDGKEILTLIPWAASSSSFRLEECLAKVLTARFNDGSLERFSPAAGMGEDAFFMRVSRGETESTFL
jgi:hypothetical protein